MAWLVQLKARISEKVDQSVPWQVDESDDADSGMLGWRTRLIQRAAQNQTVTTIRTTPKTPLSAPYVAQEPVTEVDTDQLASFHKREGANGLVA